MSDLSDSADDTRGKHKGLEKLLWDKAPHLLDIDNDVYHDIHNTLKKICKPFENFVKKIINDIHWENLNIVPIS